MYVCMYVCMYVRLYSLYHRRCIHAGAAPCATTGARSTPIYQTTAYVFDDADHAASLFNLQASAARPRLPRGCHAGYHAGVTRVSRGLPRLWRSADRRARCCRRSATFTRASPTRRPRCSRSASPLSRSGPRVQGHSGTPCARHARWATAPRSAAVATPHRPRGGAGVLLLRARCERVALALTALRRAAPRAAAAARAPRRATPRSSSRCSRS
jgi:hypothetical protein